MTVTEAKRVIEMCADAIRKEEKIYISREYVLEILNMITDTCGSTDPQHFQEIRYRDNTGDAEGLLQHFANHTVANNPLNDGVTVTFSSNPSLP